MIEKKNKKLKKVLVEGLLLGFEVVLSGEGVGFKGEVVFRFGLDVELELFLEE